jgi:hypothetical protein
VAGAGLALIGAAHAAALARIVLAVVHAVRIVIVVALNLAAVHAADVVVAAVVVRVVVADVVITHAATRLATATFGVGRSRQAQGSNRRQNQGQAAGCTEGVHRSFSSLGTV